MYKTDLILLIIGYECGWNAINNDETIIKGIFRYLCAGNERVIKRFNELSNAETSELLLLKNANFKTVNRG